MKLYSRDDLMNKAAGGFGLNEDNEDEEEEEGAERPAPADNMENIAKAFKDAEVKVNKACWVSLNHQWQSDVCFVSFSSVQKEKKSPQKQSTYENLLETVRSNVNMLKERGLEVSNHVRKWANKFVSSLRRKDDDEL